MFKKMKDEVIILVSNINRHFQNITLPKTKNDFNNLYPYTFWKIYTFNEPIGDLLICHLTLDENDEVNPDFQDELKKCANGGVKFLNSNDLGLHENEPLIMYGHKYCLDILKQNIPHLKKKFNLENIEIEECNWSEWFDNNYKRSSRFIQYDLKNKFY